MLTQVVYTSRPKFDPVAPGGRKILNEIVAAARRNNSETGITGFLVVGKDQLAQILEGDPGSVGKTLTRILADPRHEAVQLVDMRLVNGRSFSDWTMGMSDGLDAPDMQARFDRLSAEDFITLAAAADR